MRSELAQAPFDLDAYLERIGHGAAVEPTLACLDALHRAHVATIPFENLEIQLGRAMPLDPTSLSRLLVTERRGGYCFQMNGLFALAMEAIGFDFDRLMARVWMGSSEVPPGTHQLALVRVEGQEVIADVGFGGWGSVRPLPFRHEEAFEIGFRRFRFHEAGEFGSMLQVFGEDAWVDLYSFGLLPQHPVDYVPANHYVSTTPDDFFVLNRVCSISREDELVTLLNDQLSVQRKDGHHREEVADGAPYLAMLKERFGIELKPGDRLRPLPAKG